MAPSIYIYRLGTKTDGLQNATKVKQKAKRRPLSLYIPLNYPRFPGSVRLEPVSFRFTAAKSHNGPQFAETERPNI